jgi:hypothetical protein
MPPAGEVEKMETWFNRLMSGTRSIVWKVFNAAGVKPVVVGDGLDSVKDLSMSKDLRYEIHQALGTRHLLEDENLATANARERQFYTITIMPDARVIQYAFNEQVLHAMGHHLEFEPQRLEIFQEDEGLQAQSFGYLFNLFREVMSIEAAFELAAQKLDYQFTEDQQALILKGIADKQSQKPIEVIPPAIDETIPPEVVKSLVELDKWQDKVNKAGKMVTWHAVDLSPDMVKSIREGTLTFEQARAAITKPKQDDTELKVLADAINKAAAVVNG